MCLRNLNEVRVAEIEYNMKTGHRRCRGGRQSDHVEPHTLLKGLWLVFSVKWGDVAGFNHRSDII